jgi:hypothetical protein
LNPEIEMINATKTKAYAAQGATSPLASATVPRREPTPREYRFSIDMASLKSE